MRPCVCLELRPLPSPGVTRLQLRRSRIVARKHDVDRAKDQGL